MSESLADVLRASVENATDPAPLELPLPVFSPTITMRLVRIKDAKVRDTAFAGIEKIQDEADRGLESAARALSHACTGCYVQTTDGEQELPPVGRGLYTFIYGDELAPETDAEAVFALYTDGQGVCDTAAMVDAATEYMEWCRTAAIRGQGVVLGNS